CDEGNDAAQDGIPIENAWICARQPVGPKRQKKVAIRVQRDTADHVRERRAKKDRQQCAGETKHTIEKSAPHGNMNLRAQLNARAANDQQPQHYHEREVETAECGCVKKGKREVQRSATCKQPDFISVPHRANRSDRDISLRFSFGDKGMKNADAQIEAVQQDVHYDHDCNQPKPDESHSSTSRSRQSGFLWSLPTRGNFWAVVDDSINQDDEEDAQNRVHPHEAEQSK